MIKGYATIEATAEYTDGHAPVSCGLLGSTGLKASRAGFGGYRISSGVSHHEQALRTAIRSGINLIELIQPLSQTDRRNSWAHLDEAMQRF